MAEVSTAPAQQGAPVLSFPAILRNPGLTNRFAHLQGGPHEREYPRARSSAVPLKKRDHNEGKRWVRRKDNGPCSHTALIPFNSSPFSFLPFLESTAQFVGNPHIIAATKRDYAVPAPQVRPTFPEPLPSFLPRTVKLPAATAPPPTNPSSANAGRFSLSLKGMRKELRRQGGRAGAHIRDIEGEMMGWLGQGGTVVNPDGPGVTLFGRHGGEAGGRLIGETGVVVEIARTPLQLVWRIPEDAFARYVVHCVARYHEVVSFSKGTGEDRLTYLLRPNVTRPDHHARGALDTPPTTDIDYNSHTESNIDSDFLSDRDFESEAEPVPPSPALSAISESSVGSIAHGGDYNRGLSPGDEPPNSDVETWSLVDADADVESSNELEMEIEQGVEELTLQPLAEDNGDPDRTVTQIDMSPQALRPLHRPYPLTASSRRMMRSASSPSRSPARARQGRRRNPAMAARAESGKKDTLYEFVFC